MNYTGKLYCRIGETAYCELLHTSEHFDRMHEALKDELEFLDIVYLSINYPGARHLEYVRHDINARKKQIEALVKELKQ